MGMGYVPDGGSSDNSDLQAKKKPQQLHERLRLENPDRTFVLKPGDSIFARREDEPNWLPRTVQRDAEYQWSQVVFATADSLFFRIGKHFLQVKRALLDQNLPSAMD